MRHYIAYHDVDERGYPHDSTFDVRSAEPVSLAAGDTVWMITGQSRPRRYTLHNVFVVSEFGYDEADHGDQLASGRGYEIDPPAPLGNEGWFTALLRETNGLARGIVMVDDPVAIQSLKAIADKYGIRND